MQQWMEWFGGKRRGAAEHIDNSYRTGLIMLVTLVAHKFSPKTGRKARDQLGPFSQPCPAFKICPLEARLPNSIFLLFFEIHRTTVVTIVQGIGS